MIKLIDGLWLVSGEKQTHPWDASAYLIPGPEPTLIDCGSNLGFPALTAQLAEHGYQPRDVRRILATHGHWDHVAAAAAIQAEGGAELLIHAADREGVETGDEDRTASFLYDKPFPPAQVTGELHDGDAIDANGIRLQVIHTPGHSPGSVCFLADLPGLKLLIAADTLYGGFHPRIGSDIDAWRCSLDRLLGCEFDAITAGHMPPVLLFDARARVLEARQQLGAYFNPWFKPFHTEFRY